MSRVTDALRDLDEWIKAGMPKRELDLSRGHPCGRHGKYFEYLSEKPWDILSVGDLCISALGTPGRITKLEIDPKRVQFNDPDDRLITIAWENGNTSHQNHPSMNHILYLGKEA